MDGRCATIFSLNHMRCFNYICVRIEGKNDYKNISLDDQPNAIGRYHQKKNAIDREITNVKLIKEWRSKRQGKL